MAKQKREGTINDLQKHHTKNEWFRNKI